MTYVIRLVANIILIISIAFLCSEISFSIGDHEAWLALLIMFFLTRATIGIVLDLVASARRRGRVGWSAFMVSGVLEGLVCYWAFWQLFPAINAYSEGRIGASGIPAVAFQLESGLWLALILACFITIRFGDWLVVKATSKSC